MPGRGAPGRWSSRSAVRGTGRLRSGMERQVWLAERRAALVAGYDAEAAAYGDNEYPWDMQREWVVPDAGPVAGSELPAG